MQDREPERARQLHNARVGQKLGQIAAHGRHGRGIRGAEVDEEDPEAFRGIVAKIRGTYERHDSVSALEWIRSRVERISGANASEPGLDPNRFEEVFVRHVAGRN